MGVRKIITFPDAILTQVSKPVKEVTGEIKTLIEDMLETMYVSKGIGLAAVQVGVLLRIVVVDVDTQKDPKTGLYVPVNPMVFINPKLNIETDETASMDEACLSFPAQSVSIVRPKRIEVSYLDTNGTPQTLKASKLLAVCLQHEIDHLNGITIYTHANFTRKQQIKKNLVKKH
jgi:peptide deformylase